MKEDESIKCQGFKELRSTIKLFAKCNKMIETAFNQKLLAEFKEGFPCEKVLIEDWAQYQK